MAQNTLVLAPVGDHTNTISFAQRRPEDADFLYEPTINGKVYLTKSSLRALGWDGQSELRVTVAK